jgi:ubiquinone/menaquinone biosynthesis C-methylase UbiE
MKIILYLITGFPIFIILAHTILRTIRYFYKFPMPEFLANLIDNPLRRRIQPPDEMPIRHGITHGMTVLEVGPGNGRYSIETARQVGEHGRLITIDIEPKMIERVQHRAKEEGISNLEAKVADVYDLPFEDGMFDVVYMVTVIGEIPDPEKALQEFQRVLKPSGLLAFSELLMDPNYPLKKTLIQKADRAGFHLQKKFGNFFSYTLVFEKKSPIP